MMQWGLAPWPSGYGICPLSAVLTGLEMPGLLGEVLLKADRGRHRKSLGIIIKNGKFIQHSYLTCLWSTYLVPGTGVIGLNKADGVPVLGNLSSSCKDKWQTMTYTMNYSVRTIGRAAENCRGWHEQVWDGVTLGEGGKGSQGSGG